MTTLITLNIPVGGDAGPFNLYSNTDGYTTPFATGISAAALTVGYTSTVVPNGTTIIRVLSTGLCTNYIDITINLVTTTTTTTLPVTTTTTSSSSTSTTTTTAVPTTTTTSSSSTSTSTSTSTTTIAPTTTTTTSKVVNGDCYTVTYENDPESPIPPPPSDLYVRYVNSSNIEVTEQISSEIATVDNGNGTSTGAICVYGGTPPVCIQDDGINPPIAISCNPYSWILGGSCTSAFGCLTPPLIPCIEYEVSGENTFINWTDCSGSPQSYELTELQVYILCALEDTVTASGAIITPVGPCVA